MASFFFACLYTNEASWLEIRVFCDEEGPKKPKIDGHGVNACRIMRDNELSELTQMMIHVRSMVKLVARRCNKMSPCDIHHIKMAQNIKRALGKEVRCGREGRKYTRADLELTDQGTLSDKDLIRLQSDHDRSATLD